jgi:hypothetical protein
VGGREVGIGRLKKLFIMQIFYLNFSPNINREMKLRQMTRAGHVERMGKGKSKVIPLQAWTGPEGSRRLRLPDFKTIGT